MSEQVKEVPVTTDLEKDVSAFAESIKDRPVEELMREQSEKADELLSGENGYAILNELYRQLAELFMSTSLLTITVIKERDVLLALVDDPTNFSGKFDLLMNRLSNMHNNLTCLHLLHKDKEGMPKPEDIETIASVADGYSKLLTIWNTGIEPLLNELTTLVGNTLEEKEKDIK